MAKFNSNFLNLKESYLFSDIAKKVNEFIKENPEKKVIRMGIGDVTLPLADTVCNAMHKAVDEMGKAETFRGYGPEQGYDFLRNAVLNYYKSFGVSLESDEIFISDGAKSDVANITDLFDKANTVLVPDPVYPVYVDTNIMNARKIVYINGNSENKFLPMPPKDIQADMIYLCSPNNPTGAAYTREQLKEWVDYANENGAVILFDAAYEAFVETDGLARSIFEIEGAKTCAIEFCSLSKTAGFTGTRLGYTVVPKALALDADGGKVFLNKYWLRRQTTKFNGVSYIIQRGAEAVFTETGMAEIRENINYYKENAKIIADMLTKLGIEFYGGINSPYIWLKCPDGMTSWEFFDYLLREAQVVGTPGSGFGENGEGFFRLTSFNNRENTIEAMARIEKLFKKQ